MKQRIIYTISGTMLGGLIGGVVGGIFGSYAAHHCALFGGFNLMGVPYSPARYALVPGHVVLCGILLGLFCGGMLGLIGFIVGWIEDHRTYTSAATRAKARFHYRKSQNSEDMFQ